MLAAAGSARSRSLPKTNSRSRSSFLAVRRELVSSSSLPQPGLCRLAFVPLRVASSSNLLSGPPASARGADYFRSPRSAQSSGKFSARSTSGATLGILGSVVRDGTPVAAQRGKAQHALYAPLPPNVVPRALRIARCLVAIDPDCLQGETAVKQRGGCPAYGERQLAAVGGV